MRPSKQCLGSTQADVEVLSSKFGSTFISQQFFNPDEMSRKDQDGS